MKVKTVPITAWNDCTERRKPQSFLEEPKAGTPVKRVIGGKRMKELILKDLGRQVRILNDTH